MGVRRLGVMGGSFNPIHLGHLMAAEFAREAFRLDAVLFVPNRYSPFKAPEAVAPAEDRYLMVALAVHDHPAFRASRIEVDRPGPSYTVETLRRLSEEYPSAELYFITGLDAILELPRWKDPQEILRLAQIVAVSRPGHTPDEAEWALDADWKKRIRILEVPTLSVSATEIRARIAAGRSIRYLVPEPVRAYLEETGLYRA